MSLIAALVDRKNQLYSRKRSIEIYLQNDGKKMLGKKQFSYADLKNIIEDIEETDAALNGIDLYKKEKKYKKQLYANNR